MNTNPALAALLTAVLVVAGGSGCGGGVVKLLGKSARIGQKGATRGAGCTGRAAVKGTAKHGARHVPDASRQALYVTADDVGALAVRSGDDLRGAPDGLATLLAGEADGVAVTDVYFDRSVLARVSELEVAPRARWWLLGEDGAVARLLRRGADGVAEVAAATTKDGEPRLWVRVTNDLAELVLDLSAEPASIHEVVVIDEDCTSVPRAKVATDAASALTATHRVVLVVTDGAMDPRWLELARIASDDLIALALRDVCAEDGSVTAEAAAVLHEARWAATWGEVWAVAASGDEALIVGDATRTGDWVSFGADGWVASVNVYAPPSLPPWWVWAGVGGGFGGLLGAIVVWRWR